MGSQVIVRTSFEALESMGWDMDEVYETAEKQQNISFEEAKEWANENWVAEVWFDGIEKDYPRCQWGVYDKKINETSLYGACQVSSSASDCIDLILQKEAKIESVDGDHTLENYNK